jgi:hypothetical protein
MNNFFRCSALAAVLSLCAVTLACGGGGSSSPTAPSAPAAPSGPLSTAIVLVTNVSVTVEPTASGVIYRSTLTLTEVSHRSGATIASIRVNFSSSTRTGSATFDRNDNIVTALAAAGSNEYRLNVTSDNRDAFTQVTFTVTYADSAGVGGSFTSPSGTSITPVPAATTPPVLTPGPPTGEHDGTYDFFVRYPQPGGETTSQNIPRLIIILNGVVTARDGSVSSGSIDRFGRITFVWHCLVGGLGDYVGNLNNNGGVGTYTCRFAAGTELQRTWQMVKSR